MEDASAAALIEPAATELAPSSDLVKALLAAEGAAPCAPQAAECCNVWPGSEEAGDDFDFAFEVHARDAACASASEAHAPDMKVDEAVNMQAEGQHEQQSQQEQQQHEESDLEWVPDLPDVVVMPRAQLPAGNRDGRTMRALHLLALIAETGQPAAILMLSDVLRKHRNAQNVCRHHGVYQTVINVWLSQPDDFDMACACCSLFLKFSVLQMDALKKLGADDLCTLALSLCDASKPFGPIVALWARLGAALPSTGLATLLAEGDALAQKHVVRGLTTRTAAPHSDRLDEELQAALEALLVNPALSRDVMRVLCNCLPPVRLSPCPRSLPSGDAWAGGDSDSDGGSRGGAAGSDAEVDDTTLAPQTRARSKPQRGGKPAVDAQAQQPEESSVSLDAYLNQVDATGSISPAPAAPGAPDAAYVDEEHEDGVIDEATQEDADSAHLAECRAHLRLDAGGAGDWPLAYPGDGANGFRFVADFESGNLRSVRIEPDGALMVAVFSDTSSPGHCQWFHFEVQVQEPTRVRLRLVTFQKPGSTFSEGQRIFAKGPGEARWRRAGNGYAYIPNRYRVGSCGGLYTLSFTLDLSAGATRLANFVPYTCTDLLRDLRQLRGLGEGRLRVLELGPTLGGRPLPLLSISEFSDEVDAEQPRPRVLVMARTHPGEVPSSFVLRGVLEELLSDTAEADDLRRRLIFHVIPMMNPDGVAEGNTRCNATGLDLNRQWENPAEGCEAAVVKALLARVSAAPGGVLAVLDLHAHSRRHGVFTFGNPKSEALPNLLGEMHPDLFARTSCTFKWTVKMRGSARAVAWREFGVLHAHTLEVSFAALPMRERLITLADLRGFGRNLVRATGRLHVGCSVQAAQAQNPGAEDAQAGDRPAPRARRSQRQRQSATHGPQWLFVV